MKSYLDYWKYTKTPQSKPQSPPFQQYQYDAKYKVENGKLIGKLHNFLSKYVENKTINEIEYIPIRHSLGGNHYLCGFTYNYKEKVARRYLLDKDGTWYETPDLMNWWVSLGYEVNDDTLEAFAVDVQMEYYIKTKEVTK